MKELILGGARSGKSLLAEKRAAASGRQVIYVATGEAGDAEMSRRIVHHRQRRPADWRTVEAPLQLAASLARTGTRETRISRGESNLRKDARRLASVLATSRSEVARL